jgi:hypothetical protein
MSPQDNGSIGVWASFRALQVYYMIFTLANGSTGIDGAELTSGMERTASAVLELKARSRATKKERLKCMLLKVK